MQVEIDREKLELREERKGIWLAGSETVSEKKHLSGPVNGDLSYQETEVNRNSLQRTGNAMESTELVVTFPLPPSLLSSISPSCLPLSILPSITHQSMYPTPFFEHHYGQSPELNKEEWSLDSEVKSSPLAGALRKPSSVFWRRQQNNLEMWFNHYLLVPEIHLC